MEWDMNEAEAFLERFQAMTKSAINKIYNDVALSLGMKTVKRFSDKAVAIKRTRKLLVDAGQEPSAVIPPEHANPKKRQKVFRYPPESEIRVTREGYLRNKAQMLLLGGATFDEIIQMINEHDVMRGVLPHDAEKRAYELIRSLHRYCGWGLKEEVQENGEKLIFIWAKKDAKFVGAKVQKKEAPQKPNKEQARRYHEERVAA